MIRTYHHSVVTASYAGVHKKRRFCCFGSFRQLLPWHDLLEQLQGRLEEDDGPRRHRHPFEKPRCKFFPVTPNYFTRASPLSMHPVRQSDFSELSWGSIAAGSE